MRASRPIAFKHLAPLAILLTAMACGAGGGGDPAPPPPPTGLTLAPGASFDEVILSWTPPSTSVDGYAVEDRIGTAAFTPETATIPGDAIGVVAQLDPSTPELVQLGARMRSVRGGAYSAYTPEATMVRGLRPPSAPTAHTVGENVQLAWTQPSTASVNVVVQRAAWNAITSTLGSYATVATLPGTATSCRDEPTDTPPVAYSYRILNSGTLNGATVQSTAATVTADAPTSIEAPDGLQATVTAQGLRLDWTVTSRCLTGQTVARAPGSGPSFLYFNQIAALGPGAATFTDPVAPGAYTYQVSSTSTLGAGSASASIQVLVPPPAGPLGLQTQTALLPYADGFAYGAASRPFAASIWSLGRSGPLGPTLWRPLSAGWESHAIPNAHFICPGVLTDGAGHPHAFTAVPQNFTSSDSPLTITHLWHDGTQWQQEFVASRTLDNDNTRYLAEFALDPAGAAHLLWKGYDPADTGRAYALEYATNASGAWAFEPFTSALADASTLGSFRLAAAPDGTLYAAVTARIPSDLSTAGLLVRRKPSGSGWTEEFAFSGIVSTYQEMPAAILPIDAQNAGLVLIKAGVWPDIPETYVWSRRGADGWSAPVSLGTAFPGNGFSQPFGAVASAGARFALLLHTPADDTHTTGLNLMTWDAGNGWLTTWLPEWNPFALPWIGFDAQGGLHALVLTGDAGADGLAPWISMTGTFPPP